MPKVAQSLQDSTTVALKDATDITKTILAPRVRYGPPVAHSTISLYKGILKKLAQNSGRKLGVFAGTKNVIYDAILADTTEQVLENVEVKERWNSLGYVPLGVVVFNASNSISQAFLPTLLSLQSENSHLLLALFKSGDCSNPECYELETDSLKSASSSTDSTDKKKIPLIPVSLESASDNKKKGCNYTVVHVEKVGVTVADEVTALVHTAVGEYIQDAVNNAVNIAHASKQATVDKVPMVRKLVPADGLCCFHAIFHCMHFSQYSKIPRKSSGFAVHPRQVLIEEACAKNMLEAVLKQADPMCPAHSACAASLSENRGVVDIHLLPFVAQALSITIRCTIDEQAG